MILLTGSHAADIRGACSRGAAEVDLLVTMPSLLDLIEETGADIEPDTKTAFFGQWGNMDVLVEVAPPDSTWEHLLEIVEGEAQTFLHYPVFVPTLEWLLAIKMSHRFIDEAAFHQTRDDIFEFQDKGAKLNQAQIEWAISRQAVALEDHTPRSIPFFASPRVQLKDRAPLFELVKLGTRPAYHHYCDREGQLDRSKWRACTQFVRDAAVYEGACVTALEWGIIPNAKATMNPRKAFVKALDKICTSLQSGDFRRHAWHNYDRILNRYTIDWYDCYLRRGGSVFAAAIQAAP